MARDDSSLLEPPELLNFVTYRVSRVQQKLNQQAIDILRAHSDLSLVEWRTLALLGVYPDASMSRLAAMVQMDKGQVSRAVKRLAAKDLIKIRSDETDHRVQVMTLTQDGVALREKLLPIMASRQNFLMTGLSEAEIATFHKVLDHLNTVSEKREF